METHIAARVLSCQSQEGKFKLIPGDNIDEIKLISVSTGAEKTIYISKRAAWRNARKEAGLPIPSLIDSEPIPGYRDIVKGLAKREPIIVSTKDGIRPECIYIEMLYAEWTDHAGKRVSDEKAKLICSDGLGTNIEIDKDSIERVAIIDKVSGAERTIYIFEEAALAK